MLIKSASSIELGGVTNTLKGKNLIHSDLEQLENSNKLSRTNQIALIFSVLIISNNKRFS